MELRDLGSLSDDELLKLVSGRQGVDTLTDVVKQGGVGLGEGVINLAGAPGDLQSLARLGAEKVAGGPLPADPYSRMPTSANIRSEVEKWTGPFPEAKTGAGKFSRTVGEFAPGAAFPARSALQRAATVLAPAVGAEAGEAYIGGPTGRAVGGLAGGLLGAKGITPVAPARPEYAAMVKALEAEGIPISAGRSTGSKRVIALEDAASNFPFAGGRAATMNEATNRAFTGAALKRMGATGDELATPDVVDKTVKAISNKFETVGNRNNIKVDSQVGADLVRTAQEYSSVVPPTLRSPVVQKLMQDIVDLSQQTNGNIPGKQYLAWRSQINDLARSAGDNSELRTALGGIRDALDGAMGRSVSKADKALFDTARREWANWKTLEKAMTGAGSATAEGYISPSQLRTAVAGQDRGAYARGRGDLAELGRAGETVLKPLASSGTAERTNAMAAFTSLPGMLAGAEMGGAKGLVAGAVAPWGLGYGVLSRPGQAWLGNRLMPMTKEELARRLMVQELSGRPEQGQ